MAQNFCGPPIFDGTESTEEELRKMVITFRVHELQHLLGFANRSKAGKKNELLQRALEIVRTTKSLPVQQKVRELFRRRFPEQRFATDSQISSDQLAPNCVSPPLYASSIMSPYGSSSFPGYLEQKSVDSSSSTSSSSRMPNSDVRLLDLPFYDLIATLIKPTVLRNSNVNSKYQENYFTFSLNAQQVQDITYPENTPLPRYEVQLRFCLYDTTSEQKDDFPSGVEVRINEKPVALPNLIPTNKPGVEPKRPSRPVNITSYCRPAQPQRMFIFWAGDSSKVWSVSVFLVRRITANILLQRLKQRSPCSAQRSKQMIKSSLSSDNDIAATSLRVSLACPIGKMRMQIPCRLQHCQHLQCFDADLFLRMNEKKPTWMCPVCDKPTPFTDLVIDEYFTNVLAKASSEVIEIELLESGEWVAVSREDESDDDDDSRDGDLPRFATSSSKQTDVSSSPATSSQNQLSKETSTSDAGTNSLPNLRSTTSSTTSRSPNINKINAAGSSSGSTSSTIVSLRESRKTSRKQKSNHHSNGPISGGGGGVEVLIDLTEDSDLETSSTSAPPPLRTNLASALRLTNSSRSGSRNDHVTGSGGASGAPCSGYTKKSRRVSNVSQSSNSSSNSSAENESIILLDSPTSQHLSSAAETPEDPIDSILRGSAGGGSVITQSLGGASFAPLTPAGRQQQSHQSMSVADVLRAAAYGENILTTPPPLSSGPPNHLTASNSASCYLPLLAPSGGGSGGTLTNSSSPLKKRFKVVSPGGAGNGSSAENLSKVMADSNYLSYAAAAAAAVASSSPYDYAAAAASLAAFRSPASSNYYYYNAAAAANYAAATAFQRHYIPPSPAEMMPPASMSNGTQAFYPNLSSPSTPGYYATSSGHGQSSSSAATNSASSYLSTQSASSGAGQGSVSSSSSSYLNANDLL